MVRISIKSLIYKTIQQFCMFLNPEEIEKKVRVLRRNLKNPGISEELRGYAWDTPPVEPINDVKISVSDLNGFCPSRRDIYLKYVLGEKPKVNVYMLRGLAYHRVIRDTIALIKKAVYNGCETGEEIIEKFYRSELPEKVCSELGIEDEKIRENCFRLYRMLVIQAAARIDDVSSKYSGDLAELAFPSFIERKVNGSPVGLSSNLSLDVFTPYSVIMDFKSGVERYEHRLSLTGYALAVEAEDEADVDFGVLVYLRFGKGVKFLQKEFVFSDELRREFLEVRDEIAEIVDSGVDPGKPVECPKFCSFYEVCNGE